MLELLGCHLARCNSRLSRRAADTHVDAKSVVVTAGSSGGLDLLLTMFASPGDTVLVEQPTYFLALRMFADHGLRVVGIDGDGDGPSPAAVDEHAAGAAVGGTRVFLYLVPTFANPTGRCLSISRQQDLLKVARTRGIHVIEDDVYRDTTPNPPPSMWSLDHDTVTRLGSFSISLSPGLRVGFITGGETTVERIGNCGLLDSGGGVNHLASMVVGEMMHSGSFRDVASTGQQLFAGRRAALSAALDPSLFTFDRPDGGYFLRLELPEGVTQRVRSLRHASMAFKFRTAATSTSTGPTAPPSESRSACWMRNCSLTAQSGSTVHCRR